MKPFVEFLAEANEDNDAKATAYEARVAMHLHDRTHAQHNTNPDFRKAHDQTSKRYHDRMSRLSEKDRADVESAAEISATGYLKSLEKNHGIKPEDVHEVHHTAKGIGQHVGKKVNQLMNPHDVLIKTKNGKMHGSSLKMSTKSQTVSNGTMTSYDQMKKDAGLESNAGETWKDARDSRFGSGKTIKQIKAEVRSSPERRKAEGEAHKEHTTKIASTAADNFNKGSHKQRMAFVSQIAKSSPDLDYDYTAGDKDYSTPISEHPAIKKIKNAKSLTAVHNGSTSYAIHDHEGNQLMHFDFRTNHGAWVGPIVTGKFGNLKPTKKAAAAAKSQAAENPKPYSSQTSRTAYGESVDVYSNYLNKTVK